MKSLSFIFLFIVVLFGCVSDDSNSAFNIEKAQLDQMKIEIETIASGSVCGDTFECKFISFGNKPCGGPWHYIAYSTSIDFENFEAIVHEYNQMEAAFNQKWGILSDCGAPDVPVDVVCENNTCVLQFALQN